MFKRNGVYYLLLGVGCCACKGGSNIEVSGPPHRAACSLEAASCALGAPLPPPPSHPRTCARPLPRFCRPLQVYTATSPLGPFVSRGDVGSNHSNPFDKHSYYNYVTKSQGSKVFEVAAADGSTQYVFLGNQWVTSTLPGNPRNHDNLFWAVLNFDATGNITQLQWSDTTTISIAD